MSIKQEQILALPKLRDELIVLNLVTHQYSRVCFRSRDLAIVESTPPPSSARQMTELCWIIWSSTEAHLVDALAAEGDEGRSNLR